MRYETMFMRGLLIMLLAMAAVKSAKAIDFAVKEAIEKRSGPHFSPGFRIQVHL